MIGKAAFLAPEMAISPASRWPPRMSSLSTFDTPFFGSTGTHRQCVQFSAVKVRAQDLIDPLLPLHTALAAEFGTDDQRFEMVAVAGDLQMLAWQAVGNDLLDLCGVDHRSGSQFVTAAQQQQGACRNDQESCADDCQAGLWIDVGDAEKTVSETVDHVENRIEMGNALPEIR